MRKLALSSGAYQRYKLAEAIRHVALAGYAGIEVIADAPHGYPPLLNDAERKGIGASLAQNRLAVSNVNASPMTALRDAVRPSWIEADRVLREERLQHTLDAGRLAKDLGGPTLTTVAGGALEETMDRKTALHHFASGLKQAAAVVAKGKCPPILIDPKQGQLIETAAQALEIVKQARSRHVGINFNTGNFHRSGLDIAGAIGELDKAIRHVHLEDVAADGSGDVVVPGSGVIDFEAVFAALDAVGYEGWFTVDLSGADVHPDEAAKRARQFLGQFDK